MSEKTKSCNLTVDEINALVMLIGREIDEDNLSNSLERMNYLNKRLKTFNEPEVAKAPEPQAVPAAEKVGW